MKSATIYGSLIFALGAIATKYSEVFGSVPTRLSDEGRVLAQSKGHSPNDTSSVTFERPGGTWTWRVNVSDVSVPDAEGPDVQPDPHIVNVAWDLQWPGGPGFDDALRHEINSTDDCSGDCDDAHFCLTSFYVHLSDDTISKYDPDDNGDCSSLLGSDCAESLARSFHQGPPGDCPVPGGEVDGCDFTKGTSEHDGVAAFTFPLGNSTNPIKNSQNQTLQQGDMIAYHLYDAASSSDTEAYSKATHTLQLLVLQAARNVSVLCQVVDTSGSVAVTPALIWTFALAALSSLTSLI